MKELLQSLKCLLGNHLYVLRKKIRYDGEYEVEFMCKHCGRLTGGR